MNDKIIQYDHISISYGEKPAVEDISFSVGEGEILGILGESGSGKSTLLKAAMGLLGYEGNIRQGRILFDGKNLVDLTPEEHRRINGDKIGIIFQNAGAYFCPVRKIKDQLYEIVRAHRKQSRAEVMAMAAKLFQNTGTKDPERILESYPFELSGGMQQRAGIVAAMLLTPKLLLADEPASSLDIVLQKQVISEMLELRRQFNTSVIIVTHQIGVARVMADRILVLKDGRCVEQGETEKVLGSPSHEYTKRLLMAIPKPER